LKNRNNTGVNNAEVNGLFLHLLSAALWDRPADGLRFKGLDGGVWKKIAVLAHKQSVSALVADKVLSLPEESLPPRELRMQLLLQIEQTKTLNRNMVRVLGALQQEYEQAGFPFVLMKGLASGAQYPNPLLRNPGEIDVWLYRPGDYEKARVWAAGQGYQADDAGHIHYNYAWRGIVIEPHCRISYFDRKKYEKQFVAWEKEVAEQARFSRVPVAQLLREPPLQSPQQEPQPQQSQEQGQPLQSQSQQGQPQSQQQGQPQPQQPQQSQSQQQGQPQQEQPQQSQSQPLQQPQQPEIAVQVLPATLNAFFLFHHMFRHFVSLGVGFRQFCDWILFLQHYHGEIDRQEFTERVRSYGLLYPMQVFARVAVEYLDAPEEIFPFPLLPAGRHERRGRTGRHERTERRGRTERTERPERHTRRVAADILKNGNFGFHRPGKKRPPGKYSGMWFSFVLSVKRSLKFATLSVSHILIVPYKKLIHRFKIGFR